MVQRDVENVVGDGLNLLGELLGAELLDLGDLKKSKYFLVLFSLKISLPFL